MTSSVSVTVNRPALARPLVAAHRVFRVPSRTTGIIVRPVVSPARTRILRKLISVDLFVQVRFPYPEQPDLVPGGYEQSPHAVG
jgi:hypothetical protein